MAQERIFGTGVAGFTGFCLPRKLLENGRAVVGIDSVNSYYDPVLKGARLTVLRQSRDFDLTYRSKATPSAASVHAASLSMAPTIVNVMSKSQAGERRESHRREMMSCRQATGCQYCGILGAN